MSDLAFEDEQAVVLYAFCMQLAEVTVFSKSIFCDFIF